MSISGKKIVVIGGTSGIGLATAKMATERGAEAIVAGRDQAKLDAALNSIGGDARGELVDASDRAALDAMFARLNGFDHLVIAASGGSGAGPFAKLTRDDVQGGFEAKFWVQWQCAQAALPFLANDGSITFITAASARTGNPGTSGLAAINGAIGATVLPLAHEIGPIRINAVSPGVIDTPWWDRQPEALKGHFFKQTVERVPLHRVGRPEDVADAILFLAGNSYVTGIILDVDGGMRGVSSP